MFKTTQEGVVISLFVQPNAPKSQIIGIYNDQLKVKIHAPPVEGKANDEIIDFFAEVLMVSKRSLEILKGDKSKSKRLLVRQMTAAQIKEKLRL